LLSAARALTPTARGILLMLVAVLLFTAMDATVKVLVGRYPTMQVIWARFFLQFVFVVALLLWRGHLGVTLRTRFPGLHIVRSACQFATAALFFFSLRYIGLAEAQALADISPVLITLGAAVFLGERLGPRRIGGVTAAMIGALIVIRPGVGVFSPAALLPIGAAITYAAYAIITRRVGLHESPWTSMFYASAFGTAVASVLAVPVWVPIAPSDLPWFLLIGLLGSTAQLFTIRSFSIAEAAVVAPFSYAGILFATMWGILIFDQYPDRWTILGALVIVVAGLYVWHRETQVARAAAQNRA
jgi:drug/metabolite transporter (DMT)-like permease